MHPPNLRQISRLGLLAALVGGVGSAGLSASADGDIWWHLAAGREMLARGAVLDADPFSVSAAGRPWIDVHWLFQLAVYAVHQGLGLAGLVWVKSAVLGGGALVLAASLGRRARADWSLPAFVTLLLTSLFCARSLLLLRPVIVTLLFMAAFLCVLEAARRDGKRSWLWSLPVMQVVWANFQGLSALGPAMVAAYAVAAGAASVRSGKAWPFAQEAALPAGHFKALALALVACVLACGVTPFGPRAFVLPLTLATRLLPGDDNVYSSVAENVPPFLLERITGVEFWHLKWFLAILAAAMLAAGRRLRLSHALLLLGLTALALASNRNVLLLYWVGSPIAALYLAPAIRRWLGWRRARLAPSLALVTGAGLGVVLVTAGVAAAREPSFAEPTPFRVPVEGASRLAALPPGDVFCADHQGGYLIWQLYPRFRPYIDSRLVLRSAAEFQEYLALTEAPERFDAFQDRQRFRYVVLPIAYPDRYLGLIAHLYRSPDWKLLYTDSSEVLYGRSDEVAGPGVDLADGSVLAALTAASDRRFAGRPELGAAARLQLGRLLAAVGELAQAERALTGVAHSDARALLARLRYAAGDSAGAEQLAREALRADRDDVRSLSLLSRIALAQGQTELGAELLKRAVARAPFDAEVSDLLNQLQENER